MYGEPLTHEQRMIRIRHHIDRMPVLSTTVTKVLDICNRPDTSPNDLNKIISLDPVLTGRVLKLINSAYYALPNQISSLTRAIIMLGINTVKNLALSTAVLNAMKGHKSQQILPADQFWTHSLSVGVTAKALAAKSGISFAQREDYFVAGLLHDLGKIPLVECFADDYENVIQQTREHQTPLFAAERVVFGFDHGWVGKMIAEKWKLSNTIVDCLNFHHESEKASEETFVLVAIVEAANIFSNNHAIGSAGDSNPDTSHLADILQKINLAWETIDELEDQVLDEVEKAQAFIKVS